MDIYKLNKTDKIFTNLSDQTADTLNPRQRDDVELRRLLPKGFLLRKIGTSTKHFPKNETRNGLESFHNNSQNHHHHNKTHKTNTHATASCDGDNNYPRLKKTAPQIEEMHVREKKGLYTIVLHWGK